MIKLTAIVGAEPKESETVRAAIDLLNFLFQDSDGFKAQFMKLECTETQGKSMAEIWDMFTTQDFAIKIKFYRPMNPWSKVVGYVNGDGWIYVNRKFFGNSAKTAGTFAHELCHVPLGFKHPVYRYTKKEVPYQIGSLVHRVLSGK